MRYIILGYNSVHAEAVAMHLLSETRVLTKMDFIISPTEWTIRGIDPSHVEVLVVRGWEMREENHRIIEYLLYAFGSRGLKLELIKVDPMREMANTRRFANLLMTVKTGDLR